MKTMHMKKLREKGITLIALVITIVVLIILAAVAINLSLGNNGIFNRAKTAKEQYQNSEEQEKDGITKATNEINSYVDGNRDTVTISKEEYDMLKNDYYYSTGEKIVGKWINGKPIYRTIINSGSVNMKGDNVIYTDSTIENVLRAEGTLYSGTTELTLPVVQSGSFLAYFIKTGSDIKLRGGYTTSQTWNIGFIILEYTKTTD